jgi:ABC-type branched-subunit amino acid transport system substrate-binding protein
MRCSKWKPLGLFCITLLTAVRAYAEVLIGDSSPLTGPLSWAGEQAVVGTELAVADINARGGVLGEQIQVMSVDDACETQQALAAAQKLIAEHAIGVRICNWFPPMDCRLKTFG